MRAVRYTQGRDAASTWLRCAGFAITVAPLDGLMSRTTRSARKPVPGCAMLIPVMASPGWKGVDGPAATTVPLKSRPAILGPADDGRIGVQEGRSFVGRLIS